MSFNQEQYLFYSLLFITNYGKQERINRKGYPDLKWKHIIELYTIGSPRPPYINRKKNVLSFRFPFSVFPRFAPLHLFPAFGSVITCLLRACHQLYLTRTRLSTSAPQKTAVQRPGLGRCCLRSSLSPHLAVCFLVHAFSQFPRLGTRPVSAQMRLTNNWRKPIRLINFQYSDHGYNCAINVLRSFWLWLESWPKLLHFGRRYK